MRELQSLPEYHALIREKNLRLTDSLQLKLSSFGTNTSGNYDIVLNLTKVGSISLSYIPRLKSCFFDIHVINNGKNIGANTLISLAKKLNEYGYILITSGVMPESKSYWEKMRKKGIVTPNKDGEELKYTVLIQS